MLLALGENSDRFNIRGDKNVMVAEAGPTVQLPHGGVMNKWKYNVDVVIE